MITTLTTLTELAEKALKKDFTITNEEAINIWLLLPNSCERVEDYTVIDKIYSEEKLIIKGLGEFNIVN